MRPEGEDNAGGYVQMTTGKVDKLEIKDIVADLADEGGRHYIRLDVVLEYPRDQKRLAEEIREKEHHIREALVLSLRSKTVAEVNDIDTLKESLLKDVNKNLYYGRVTGIYFANILLQ